MNILCIRGNIHNFSSKLVLYIMKLSSLIFYIRELFHFFLRRSNSTIVDWKNNSLEIWIYLLNEKTSPQVLFRISIRLLRMFRFLIDNINRHYILGLLNIWHVCHSADKGLATVIDNVKSNFIACRHFCWIRIQKSALDRNKLNILVQRRVCTKEIGCKV